MLTTLKRRVAPQRKVCIGVCAYNEEKNIGLLLKNLLAQQDLLPNCEIIVACSGCTDSTPHIVGKFQEADQRVKVITQIERGGKAQALNLIFERASGSEALILTNADAIPDAGSINRLVKALYTSNVGAVTGRPIPFGKSVGLSGKIVKLIWDLHHMISTCESVKMSGELCAIRSSLVNRIPANLATDEPYIEMLIRRQGYKIGYVPDAVVYIRCPDKFIEIIKHRRRIWAGHLHIKKMEGFTVSTSDFRKILSTLVKSFRFSFRNLHVLVLFTGIEILSYLLARYDVSRGKIPFVWETLKSTKTVCAESVEKV